MSQSEFCSVVLENGATRKYTVINYNIDGMVKREIRSEAGIGTVVAELNREGWEYAFRDEEGVIVNIFFKREKR